MANNKKSSSNKSTISLSKVAFWTIVAAAILYLVGIICSFIPGVGVVVKVFTAIASAVMVVIAAIVAWKYVKNKQIVWKILYIVCLLVVIVGIIIPSIF